MRLIRQVMPRLFAWGFGFALVFFMTGASAQSPVIEIDAELGLPTASDIDGELAARIAAEVNADLETRTISALEEAKSRRPHRALRGHAHRGDQAAIGQRREDLPDRGRRGREDEVRRWEGEGGAGGRLVHAVLRALRVELLLE